MDIESVKLLSLTSGGTSVIGSFSYSEHVAPDVVGVAMSFGPRKEKLGTLIVPADTLRVMAAEHYPPVDEALPLETALAYALTIAIKADLRLRLTGDAGVWEPKWGMLVGEHQPRRAAN